MNKKLLAVALGGGAIVGRTVVRKALRVLADDQPSDWLTGTTPGGGPPPGAADRDAPTAYGAPSDEPPAPPRGGRFRRAARSRQP